jgi:NADH:ubiquinone oxidoreductase subunit E
MGVVILQNNAEPDMALDGFYGKPEELISLLQYFQTQYGYLSEENVRQIALFLKISEAQIYGVASFYSQFKFTKPGRNRIRVCLGTACHVQGGEQLSQETQNVLGIHPGQTTEDHSFDFQEVACLGCCALAPVVEINSKIHGKMAPEPLRKALQEYGKL